jgi:hypothetical protein
MVFGIFPDAAGGSCSPSRAATARASTGPTCCHAAPVTAPAGPTCHSRRPRAATAMCCGQSPGRSWWTRVRRRPFQPPSTSAPSATGSKRLPLLGSAGRSRYRCHRSTMLASSRSVSPGASGVARPACGRHCRRRLPSGEAGQGDGGAGPWRVRGQPERSARGRRWLGRRGHSGFRSGVGTAAGAQLFLCRARRRRGTRCGPDRAGCRPPGAGPAAALSRRVSIAAKGRGADRRQSQWRRRNSR